MAKTVMVTQSSGMDVLKRAEGDFFKVGELIFYYIDDNSFDGESLYPATILKLYKSDTDCGLREFADIKLECDGSIIKRCYTMFFEKESVNGKD